MVVPKSSKSTANMCQKRNAKFAPGVEMIQLLNPDAVRELVVPRLEPRQYAAVFPSKEYSRLKQQAKILTFQDKVRMMRQEEERKQKLMQECLTRKEAVKNWEKRREKGQRLNDLEEDARKRATYLLRRAFELQQEQEDEIKTANKMILSAKCQAIRDAQVQEKLLMEKELAEEDQRLEMMMEQERRRGLEKEEEKKEKEKARTQANMQQVMAQIEENEIQRLIDAERIDEESRLLTEAQVQLQIEEMEAQRRKAAEVERMKEELENVNKQLRYFKELEKEEDHIAELKVQEFQRLKAEREAAREEELAAIKQAKEKEIARLRALQERSQDKQAQLDDENAQRIQDQVEREWRRKEAEAVARRRRGNEELKRAREQQVLDRQRMQALEMARERREFERVLQVQRLESEKERLQDIKRKNDAAKHRETILRQINEKETERIKERKVVFEEGECIQRELERRDRNIKEILQKKVKDLRHYNVPEKYVKQIERTFKMDS